jgi:cyclase
MLKKRVIFTLLYADGSFVLSRNFRLQKVGNLDWLNSNYNFSHISCAIDELVVLDVSRNNKSLEDFCSVLKKITKGCFIPITAGGGIETIDAARMLLRSGADKVLINSALYHSDNFIDCMAGEFGQQCVVASMDIKKDSEGCYKVWSNCGSKRIDGPVAEWVERVSLANIGELYLNSMDKDGTGQGYDLGLLDLLPIHMSKSVILAGGVGNASHLAAGLSDSRVDAVATAHLFNFVGDGLIRARNLLIDQGIELPSWEMQ